MKKLLILLSFAAIAAGATSCVLVEKIAGADVDEERFRAARLAKMLELRQNAAEKLRKRLAAGDPIENADALVNLSEAFLNRLAEQYNSTRGALDESMTYVVRSVELDLDFGSAIVSLDMRASHSGYGVDVDLTTDCVMSFEKKDEFLVLRLEPFNISPNVETGVLLAGTKNIIKNLVKVNLAELEKKFPPIKIPLELNSSIDVPANSSSIRDKINLDVEIPARKIEYGFKLKEILILEGRVVAAFMFDKIKAVQ